MKTRAKRSVIWKLPKNEFIDLIKNSNSLGEVLRYFGMENKGGNSYTLKKRCQIDNVDYSHIKTGINSNKGRKFPGNETPLELILIESSSYSRSHLKRRLIKENILDLKCSNCKLKPIWNDQPLVMVLDHINGVSNDNRLENLRLLCPNCNSQTDTFAGRNIKSRT